jgi:NDP-sugar pyrophosphorylase family protein
MDTQNLKKELETYAKNLPSLLSHEGKFVVISGDVVNGIYDSYNDALKVGYEKFGLKTFLVKKISSTEQISFFTRDYFKPCHI